MVRPSRYQRRMPAAAFAALAALWIGGVAWCASDARAAANAASADTHARRFYRACMKTARTRPKAALEEALAWAATGDELASRHCAATALQRLGRHGEAARMLEAVVGDMASAPKALRARLLHQSARAWLRARRPERAVKALGQAIALRPADMRLRADRGLVLALINRMFEAIDDFNAVLEAEPKNADVLVLRAATYRKLKSLELAQDDLRRALALRPDHPDALLERGILRLVKKDVAGARADWIRVVHVAPRSAAAVVARRKLAKLNQSGK